MEKQSDEVTGKADVVALLGVVAGIYAKSGSHGASIRNIAAAVGLAPSALYYYFGSKGRMIQMALSERGRHALQTVLSHGMGDDDELRLENRVRAALDVIAFDPEYGRVHSRQVVSFANGDTDYFPTSEFRTGIHEFVGLRLRGGPITTERTAFEIGAMLHGLAEFVRVEKRLAGGGPFSDEERSRIARQATDAAFAIASSRGR